MKSGILFVAAIITLSTVAAAADLPKEELLWPEGAPGKSIIAHKQPEKNTLMIGKTGKPGGGASFVSTPTMMVFPADKAKATHAAIVVFPGGGYRTVVLGKEGVAIAQKLNEMGFTAIVVKYRTMALSDPNHSTPEEWKKQLPTIIGDGARAVELVRGRAKELGVDPNKIGVMGFSAGAHLSASLMVSQTKGPSRPDFACMIYGGLWDRYDEVPAGMGPCFIAMAADDNKVDPSGIIEFFKAIRKVGTKAELHIYQDGNHGFGIGKPGQTNALWMDEFAVWLRQNGFAR